MVANNHKYGVLATPAHMWFLKLNKHVLSVTPAIDQANMPRMLASLTRLAISEPLNDSLKFRIRFNKRHLFAKIGTLLIDLF